MQPLKSASFSIPTIAAINLRGARKRRFRFRRVCGHIAKSKEKAETTTSARKRWQRRRASKDSWKAQERSTKPNPRIGCHCKSFQQDDCSWWQLHHHWFWKRKIWLIIHLPPCPACLFSLILFSSCSLSFLLQRDVFYVIDPFCCIIDVQRPLGPLFF